MRRVVPIAALALALAGCGVTPSPEHAFSDSGEDAPESEQVPADEVVG
jgi:hypothetical protein